MMSEKIKRRGVDSREKMSLAPLVEVLGSLVRDLLSLLLGMPNEGLKGSRTIA